MKIMASGPIASWQIDGETVETVIDLIFLGSKITVDSDCSYEIKRRLASRKESYDKSRQCIKKQTHHSAYKCPYSQGYGLPSGHIWLWKLDCEEGRAPKNWFLQTVVLEKTPESPLDSKEIKPVNLKGNQPWIFTGRTNAEVIILWPPDSLERTLKLGKIEGRRSRERQRMSWLESITN